LVPLLKKQVLPDDRSMLMVDLPVIEITNGEL